MRRNHPEDYPEYVKGCDIASFDIYPAVHDHKDIAGKLWFVADGVSRLRKWTDSSKPVWTCTECTHIGNPKAKATPAEVKAEVWMSLIRGSRGIIYFCHQFSPKFIEAGLLADAGKPLPFIDKLVFSREKEGIPYWNKFLQGYYDTSGIG